MEGEGRLMRLHVFSMEEGGFRGSLSIDFGGSFVVSGCWPPPYRHMRRGD